MAENVTYVRGLNRALTAIRDTLGLPGAQASTLVRAAVLLLEEEAGIDRERALRAIAEGARPGKLEETG